MTNPENPFPFFCQRRAAKFLCALVLACLVVVPNHSRAGGGGENLLLIVNPADEPSLRIANAYIEARKIPASNVLYIKPPGAGGFATTEISPADFSGTYQTPILNAIAARGLSNQIDYISTIGQPTMVNPAGSENLCLHNVLNHLTQLQNGLTLEDIDFRDSELFQNTELRSRVFNYTPGSNAAIHHRQVRPRLSTNNTGPATVQWYMAGTLNQFGQFGLTTTQVIQNIKRTVSGDGKKPFGVIYFENNSDIRSTTRAPYWPPVQSYMSAHGIPWVQEENAYTPVGIKNVRGAEIGLAWVNYIASTYLPGAWADSLTSNGGGYISPSQTTACNALLAGCGASSGTVIEPYAIADRFPYACIWVYQNDGSTLGEAFYKSIYTPDLCMFQGDLLSQAYADVPDVVLSASPQEGSGVSGIVTIGGTASLASPQTATGIAKLALFVDGLDSGLVASGSTGSFNWDSTTAPDGVHELRIVAYNNSLAESEGYAIRSVQVNNAGQSISVSGSSFTAGSTEVLSVPISVTTGSGPVINAVQLQSYGRVISSGSGNPSSLPLDASLLAFGVNTITPTAVLANGKQVQGWPVKVTRHFAPLRGTTPTAQDNRNPGFDYFYYTGAAGRTLATTNFAAKPSHVQHSNVCQLSAADANKALWNLPAAYRSAEGGSMQGVAILIKGSFIASHAGEYSFYGNVGTSGRFTSYSLEVDGTAIASYDLWNGSSFDSITNGSSPLEQLRSVYLLPGEHTVTVKLVQYNNTPDTQCKYQLYFRGMEQDAAGTHVSSIPAIGPFFYTSKRQAVP